MKTVLVSLLTATAVAGGASAVTRQETAAAHRTEKPPPLHLTIPPVPIPPATPAGVAKIKDPIWRHMMQRDLTGLDAFLYNHPQMGGLRDRLWRLAETEGLNVTPARLAGIVWCAVYAPSSNCRA